MIIKIRTIVLIFIYLHCRNQSIMEGKQKFDYEKAEVTGKNEKDMQEIMVRVLQVILGIIMAILHA